MIRVLSIGVFLGFMTTAASAQGTAAAVERGTAVYAAQKCATCHAIAGKGNPRGALDTVGDRLTREEIRQWIVAAPEMTAKTKSTRKPLMKSYTLPAEDFEALVAYMQTLKKR